MLQPRRAQHPGPEAPPSGLQYKVNEYCRTVQIKFKCQRGVGAADEPGRLSKKFGVGAESD